jgi:hypothetical protein
VTGRNLVSGQTYSFSPIEKKTADKFLSQKLKLIPCQGDARLIDSRYFSFLFQIPVPVE